MPHKPKTYRPAGYKSHDQLRGSRSKRGYDAHWYKVIRPRILLRDLYVCQKCGVLTLPGSKGPRGPHVDHIDNDGPSEDWNLRTLCGSCNSRKQDRQDG